MKTKPNNVAELKRFLVVYPYLRWTHPGFGKQAVVHSNVGVKPHPGCDAKTEVRKFECMRGGRFVFQTAQGTGSELESKAKYFTFDETGFNVAFHEDWRDMAGKSMRYDYIDSETYEKGKGN